MLSSNVTAILQHHHQQDHHHHQHRHHHHLHQHHYCDDYHQHCFKDIDLFVSSNLQCDIRRQPAVIGMSNTPLSYSGASVAEIDKYG